MLRLYGNVMNYFRLENFMKKFIFALIIMAMAFFWGCKDFSCYDIWTYKAPRASKSKDVDELKKKAAKYESRARNKQEFASELGLIYYELGQKYLDRHSWDLSIESFEKALMYGKNTAIVHYSLGLAYANKGKDLMKKEDIDRAEAQYKKALGISGDYSDARYALGVLLFYEKDDKEEGIKMMEQLVMSNRNYYRAFFALGRFYYEMNKPEKSLAVYEDVYSELQKKSADSKYIQEYKDIAKQNIDQLMQEIGASR
jgi:tetratricopeptide (TPR) repeat protein